MRKYGRRKYGADPYRCLDVTPARRRSYVAAFILLSLLGYGVVIWRHIAGGPGGATCAAGANDGSVAAIAESLMIGFAIAHAAAFGLALVTAEITGGFMVLADYLRTKLVVPLQEKLRNEGRAQGRSAERLEWRAWNRRRRQA